jgi:hypothetical protein
VTEFIQLDRDLHTGQLTHQGGASGGFERVFVGFGG